jgi:hypothetical protein
MVIPLSIYRDNAIVPINERIPRRRMTSKKAVLLKKTEMIAIPEIMLMLRASSA